VRRAAWVLACAAAAMVVLPGATAASGPSVAACALGALPAPLRTTLPAGLAERGRRYVAALPAADRARADTAFTTAAAAYVFAMPTVLERATVAKYPTNALVAIADLAQPASRTVVAPNHDTFYFVSHVDLREGPLVLDAPPTGGRYSVVQLLDANTNVVANVGAGHDRDRAQQVAIVPPGWQGALPAGVTAARSPTNTVWLLGRTLIGDAADLPAARRVLAGYALTPLAQWQIGERAAATILDTFPTSIAPVVLPVGLAFLDAASAALAADPPLAADACALRAFAAVGIAPGMTPSGTADPVVRAALAAGAHAGDALVDDAAATLSRTSRRHNRGWWVKPSDVARFGTDYVGRAVIARVALGANRPSETLYPTTNVDSAGRPLSGAHRYVVTFRAGQLPPARAFWSLTLYNVRLLLAANRIDRYAIGDRSPGLRYGPGRSLTLYVQHTPPKGVPRANWLPAPTGRFSLYLRLYEPKRAAIDGRWPLPSVRRVGSLDGRS
jgi:hypothetical protein